MNESDEFVKSMVLPSLVLVAIVFFFFTGQFGLGPGMDADDPVVDDGEPDEVMERAGEPEVDSIQREWEEGEERVQVDPVAKEEAPEEGTRIESGRFDEFVDLFEAHYEENQRRMLHMTIDRPMYRPGQTLNWRSWHLAAGSFTGDDAEGEEVTVELVSPRDDVVDEEELEIQGGMVSGVFDFDDEARGGSWTLRMSHGDEEYERPVLVSHFEPPRFRQELDFSQRAYRPGEQVQAEVEILRDTGEPMRGFEVEGYLQVAGRHVADVSETLDGLGRATITAELPSRIREDNAILALTIEEGGMTETEIYPVSLALEDVKMAFQPEGGELVEGLSSRVYFEATDLSGDPVEVEGVVVDSGGEIVAELESEHRGRGRFEMTPEQGESYEVALSSPEEVEERYSLPEAISEGCVLRLYDDYDGQADAVRAGVWCTEGRLVGIVGAMGDEIFDVATMTAGPDEPAVAYLKPEEKWPRPAGTVRVSVFREDDQFDPVAERVSFRGRRARLNLEVGLERDVYHPGEEVDLEFRVTGPDGEPVMADLAMAVVDDRVHARAHHEVPSILSQLLLKSDDLHFWGDIDEADEYFDLYEAHAAAGLDLLMGVRGWRDGDQRDGFYVDGADEKIEELIVRHRRERVMRRPPAPRPRPEAAGVGGLGLAGAGRGGGGGGEIEMLGDGAAAPQRSGAFGAAEAEPAPAEPAPAEPAPVEDLEAAESEESAGDAGAAQPWWARDDDAAAFAAWEPKLTTGSDGRVTHRFELPEAIGAYRVSVDGIGGGLAGADSDVVRIEVPLSVALRMPEIMSGDDGLMLPLTVRNTTESILDTELEITTEGPVSVADRDATAEISVPPASTATHFVPVMVDDARGEGTLRVQVQGGGFTDGAERTFEIEPKGYDRSALFSGQLPGHDRHNSPLRGMTESGAVGDLVIYPSPAAEALEGIESMSRRPTGCFEQASGSNHPNVLVWKYLEANGQLDASSVEQLERNIDAGYQLLKGYEISDGGFEWFGRPPAQAALSSWGLVQFTAMKEIVDDFDDAILDRTVEFLRSLQADDGSWDSGNSGAWQRISPNNRTPAELLVIFGLARVGETEGFEKQLEDAANVATESEDLYEIALATAALASANYDSGAVDAGMSRLLERQDSDGGWSPQSGRSWTWGYGNSFDVETTGLATLALVEGGGPSAAIGEAVDWLGDRKTARGWWGSTQATVMALEARIAYEREGLDITEGNVALVVDGETVEEIFVESGDLEPVRLSDWGGYLTDGTEEIAVRSELGVEYDIELDWRVEQFDTDDGGPLAVDFRLGDGHDAQMGDEVGIELDVANLDDDRLGMVIARVALPAGVEVGDRELDALVERSAVDSYETTGRDVILYFEDMDANEEHSLRFSATAAVPGRFEVPASVAYPYYRDESHWQWGERSEFRVHRP